MINVCQPDTFHVSENRSRYKYFDTPQEFLDVKTYILQKFTNAELAKSVKETPIYFHLSTTKYYFPLTATIEDGTSHRRIIKTNHLPLKFDIPSGTFYHTETKERYCEVDSPADFEQTRIVIYKRNAVLQQKQIVDQTPIYCEEESKTYYYPVRAKQERDFMPRKVLNKKPKVI